MQRWNMRNQPNTRLKIEDGNNLFLIQIYHLIRYLYSQSLNVNLDDTRNHDVITTIIPGLTSNHYGTDDNARITFIQSLEKRLLGYQNM